jgi:hypothetical protein
VLGRTIALSLPAETCPLGPVLSHSKVSSRRAVREMKRGCSVTSWSGLTAADVILVAVPQAQLASVLEAAVEDLPGLKGKRLLIMGLAGVCGARSAIERLQKTGAEVGGLLPIALYRRPSFVAPQTTFAIWGSVAALRDARHLVQALSGRHTLIDPGEDAHVLLAVALVTGVFTTTLELAVRRLVHAGFMRKRAIEALSPLADGCLQEHARSRSNPPGPQLPSDCSDLMRALARAEPLEATLCHAGLRFASEDLR